MLSKDEITQRSLRLSGRLPNKYTGTLNDPFQEAQSNYAGPGWAQFFGGLQQTEEDAALEGKHYRTNWQGFGNTVDEGGGSVPRRQSLAAMSASPADENTARTWAINQALSDMQDERRAREAQQRILNSQASLAELGVKQAQSDATDRESLDRTLAPRAEPTTITRTPGMVGPQLPGSSAGNPTITARPAGPVDPRAMLLNSVPGHLRPGLEATLAAMDLKAQTGKLEAGKLEETIRKNKADEALAANSVMSPEAIDQNADLYLKTGVMPPLGMKDPNNRQRILNRAAEKSAGGGGNVAANKADYKADADSLKKLQGQRDAIGAFESTAGKNIDIFLNAAGKVVDTGSPLANTLARQVSGKMLGSPDQAAYDAARQVAINEIAKITSNPTLSGQLSDSARHEVDAFNPANATLKQTVAVMRILKQDMGNRITSLDDALTGIKGRIGQPAGAPPAPAGFVDMIAPDGGPLHVPAADVEKMLKAGAKRKGGG